MASIADEKKTCPLCRESERLQSFWKKPDFFRCDACGAIFRDPFPSEQALKDLYEKSWSAPEASRAETGATDSGVADAIAGYLLRFTNSSSFAGKRILDFGGGLGAMATALKRRGADVYVVEPFGVDYLTGRGFKAYRFLEDIPPALTFDGITSLEVVEHLPDPTAALRQLSARLAPGGWLFVTTPNPEGLNAAISGASWREAEKPGHLLFFPATTLKLTLERSGFAQVERKRWPVRFPNRSATTSAIQFLMQAAMVDGSVRMLARKPVAP
jgi:2-polyprenyl-3-methyl-5-hydroxy-6-metoxy-1,4-benzoquinol methylase